MPFSKFKYNCLPMGVKQSPDISQEIMEDILRDIEEVDVYINDVSCFDSSWQQHLRTFERMLSRLGATASPLILSNANGESRKRTD